MADKSVIISKLMGGGRTALLMLTISALPTFSACSVDEPGTSTPDCLAALARTDTLPPEADPAFAVTVNDEWAGETIIYYQPRTTQPCSTTAPNCRMLP